MYDYDVNAALTSKGQVISKAIFLGFRISQKVNEIFYRISALASKMDQFKIKIMAQYYTNALSITLIRRYL